MIGGSVNQIQNFNQQGVVGSMNNSGMNNPIGTNLNRFMNTMSRTMENMNRSLVGNMNHNMQRGGGNAPIDDDSNSIFDQRRRARLDRGHVDRDMPQQDNSSGKPILMARVR